MIQPSATTKSITVRFDMDLFEKIQDRANRDRRSVNQQVLYMLEWAFYVEAQFDAQKPEQPEVLLLEHTE